MTEPLQIRRGDKVRVQPSMRVYRVLMVSPDSVKIRVVHRGAEWDATIRRARCELVHVIERLADINL